MHRSLCFCIAIYGTFGKLCCLEKQFMFYLPKLLVLLIKANCHIVPYSPNSLSPNYAKAIFKMLLPVRFSDYVYTETCLTENTNFFTGERFVHTRTVKVHTETFLV